MIAYVFCADLIKKLSLTIEKNAFYRQDNKKRNDDIFLHVTSLSD